MGELVLLCESRTMRWEMCSSVRVLLCERGEVGVLMTEDLVRVDTRSVLTDLYRF